MPRLSPHKDPQRDEASSTSLPANSKPAKVVVPKQTADKTHFVRRSLRARAPLQKPSYKEQEEDDSECDSETNWEPKDSSDSGSDWSDSGSKKKRDEQILMPRRNVNITSTPVATTVAQPKTSYTAASKVPPSQTNIMTTNGLTRTNTPTITIQSLNGGN